MSDDDVRRERYDNRFAPNVEPINRLVDEIGQARRVSNLPLLDPTFGGVNASVLFMLKAPEADANPDLRGRRFLSLDNDDIVAARMFDTCRRFGMDREHLVAWNICPFPIRESAPDRSEFAAAAPYNARLLRMLTRLKAVVLLGAPARKGWYETGLGSITSATVFEGASPSPPGINRAHNLESYERAMSSAAVFAR